MECKYCKTKMRLDDCDVNFKGNYDNYWICDNCNGSCIEKIRYGKSINIDWYTENEKYLEGK